MYHLFRPFWRLGHLNKGPWVYSMSRLRLAMVCTPPSQCLPTPPSVSVPPFGYLRSFKSDLDAVKGKVGLLYEQINNILMVPRDHA